MSVFNFLNTSSINTMLTSVSERFLRPISQEDICQLERQMAGAMHPPLTDDWQPSRPYLKAIIHVHGPSGAGKSQLSLRLQAELGGKKNAVILERDAYIQASLNKTNNQSYNKKKTRVQDLYDSNGRMKNWAWEKVFKPADAAMERDLQAALHSGKKVIWDTMKELPHSLNGEDVLVVRMVTRCLDDPKNRDFNALAQRKPGSMTVEKQAQLASIEFDERFYETKLNGGTGHVVFNAFYGWTSSTPEKPGVEVKVFFDKILTLLSGSK